MITFKSFAPLRTPNYRHSQVGSWALAEEPFLMGGGPVVAGYWNLVVPLYQNWVLREDGRIWMSLSPMELESQGYQARLAKGHVIVAGLGMGVLAWNLLQNPRVDRITIVEKNEDVVKLMAEALPDLLEDDKTEVVLQDAKTYAPTFEADVLIADIWPLLGATEAVADVKLMLANTRVKRVAWWGQEFDLVYAMMNNKVPLTEPRKGLELLEAEVGAKLVGRSFTRYPDLAVQAVTLQAMAREQKLIYEIKPKRK